MKDAIPLMSIKAIKETVVMARTGYVVLVFHCIYSAWEIYSHTAAEGWTDHVDEHFIALGAGLGILLMFRRALLELFFASERPQ